MMRTVPDFPVQPNERLPLHIVHEAEGFLVVEKPAGLVSQPGKGHERDTLLNALFARYGQLLTNLGKARDWGLLHRLDREASGLMLVGLRTRAYDALREAFERREIEKRYWAVVIGKPAKESGVIRAPIQEATRGPSRMRIAQVARRGVRGAQSAITAYRVLQTTGRASLLECRIGTGRLHQIRVHLESIGCPVVGDGIYGQGRGSASAGGSRLALHAGALGFRHPETGQPMIVQSEWPADLAGLLRRLKLRRPHPLPAADVSESARDADGRGGGQEDDAHA